MEIGSFLQLDINPFGEYFTGNSHVARLNSARCGIYHSLRLYNCSTIYIPYYLCSTVSDFLTRKGIMIKKYSISSRFEPQISSIESEAAILIVNYFGILSQETLIRIKGNFDKVIFDFCPSFYSEPIKGCYSVYSTRKFFGVPDGSYVIGEKAEKYTEEYKQDLSAHTSGYLLKKIESGGSASYSERMKNERRIDRSDILRMSELTSALLKGIDYQRIRAKRRENFEFAFKLFAGINLMNPEEFISELSIPMVYPLLIEDATIVDKLREKQIFTGRWWNHVLKEVPEDSFEAWMSKYMVPVPIDQRYGEHELKYIFNEITDLLL